MAINFKLGAKRLIDEKQDRMGRSWVGWDPTLASEDIFEQNRGIWLLGQRAGRERYATFSVDGYIKVVAEIDGIVEISPKGADKRKKSAVAGRALGTGDPAYDFFIERDVDRFRNPVSYIDNPEDNDDAGESPKTCACGCGAALTGWRDFAPGHDQKAIHERINRQWGSTLAFIDWFDATYPAADTRKAA